jgi:biopolymer transport protein ExbD
MIDIMFLMLLFFMLGADMTQRELQTLELPKANQIKEDPKFNDPKFTRTTVNLHHLEEGEIQCAAFAAKKLCREESHWAVSIRGKPFPDWAQLRTFFEERAKAEMEEHVDPIAGQKLSGHSVIIRADQWAPYGFVQKIITTAGAAGLYKVEVAASKPEPGT